MKPRPEAPDVRGQLGRTVECAGDGPDRTGHSSPRGSCDRYRGRRLRSPGRDCPPENLSAWIEPPAAAQSSKDRRGRGISSVPTGTSALAKSRICLASLSDSGTPRRRTPIRARSFAPPLFSTISCASLLSVRPISSAERSCLFSTTRISWHILTQSLAATQRRNPGVKFVRTCRILDPRGRVLGVSSPERARIPQTASGVDLRVSVGSTHLKNPIIAASGTFGYGVEFAELVDLNRLGGIVVKGLSLHPMAGAPPPRMLETPSGMINAIGLQNIGVRAFVAEKLPQLRRFDTAIIANVFGHTLSEYLEVIRVLEDTEGIAAYELNISCPNVERGGAEYGTNPELAAELVSASRKACRRPLWVKLSPTIG